jgi:hypothetical protein
MSNLLRYKNAKDIFSSKNWVWVAPYMKNVPVLFDSKKMPFYIKNGKRTSFNKRGNHLFYGNGNYNYLMNTPANAKNVFAHYSKFKNTYGLRKRSPVKNTSLAYKVLAAKKKANNKKLNAQNKRVNKLANNVKAGRNVSKAKLGNLVALIVRYQHPNAGPYYTMKNGHRTITNNYGKKPTRKQVLANIANMKNYNVFRNNLNRNNSLSSTNRILIRKVQVGNSLNKYNANNLIGFIVKHQQANYGPYYHPKNNNYNTYLNNEGQVPNRKKLENNTREIARQIVNYINLKKNNSY